MVDVKVTDHRDPDEAYLLLRALISLTLAFASHFDIDEDKHALLLRKASEAQKDRDGALSDEEDGINEGVVAVLNELSSGERWIG
jgi:hypothetical protein